MGRGHFFQTTLIIFSHYLVGRMWMTSLRSLIRSFKHHCVWDITASLPTAAAPRHPSSCTSFSFVSVEYDIWPPCDISINLFSSSSESYFLYCSVFFFLTFAPFPLKVCLSWKKTDWILAPSALLHSVCPCSLIHFYLQWWFKDDLGKTLTRKCALLAAEPIWSVNRSLEMLKLFISLNFSV